MVQDVFYKRSNALDERNRVRLSEVFRFEYIPLVEEYVDRIKAILKTDDTALLVARKGVCFFYALEANGFFTDVQNEKKHYPCGVMSTRALSYNLLVPGKTLAIVDDVMVSGKAMRKALGALDHSYDSIEYLVAAACPSLVADGKQDMPTETSKDEDAALNKDALLDRVHPIRRMGKKDVLEFAREITQFIQASGISNNIDHPVFLMRAQEGRTVEDVLAPFNAVNTTTGTQRHYGIKSRTITFDAREIFTRELFEMMGNAQGLIAKCRIVSRKGAREFELIPFVILPELSSSQLEDIFNTLTNTEVKMSCDVPNDDERLRNMLRVTQFALSQQLGWEFVNRLHGTDLMPGGRNARIDTNRVIAIFGSDITDGLYGHSYIVRSMGDAVGYPRDAVSPQLLRQHVGNIRVRSLSDAKASGGIVGDYSGNISVSGNNIFGYVKNYNETVEQRRLDEGTYTHIASLALDSLIDRGVFVPYSRVRHSGKDRFVVRAYHGGEIERMSDELIAHFALFLLYVQGIRECGGLPREIVNALGVIFARYVSKVSAAQPPSPSEPIAYAFDDALWGLRAGEANDRSGESLTDILLYRCLADRKDNDLICITSSDEELFSQILDEDNARTRSRCRAFTRRLADALCAAWAKNQNPEQFMRFLRNLIAGESWRYSFGILRKDVDTIGAVLRNGFRHRRLSELVRSLASAKEKLRYRDNIDAFASGLYEEVGEDYASILDSLLQDPYSSKDERGRLSRLYSEIRRVVNDLSERLYGPDGTGSPTESALDTTTRSLMADKVERLTLSVNALFGGTDLNYVPPADAEATEVIEARVRRQSRVLANKENVFNFHRLDIVALGLNRTSNAQYFPSFRVVTHDPLGTVRWGEEFAGADGFSEAHVVILFPCADACISLVDENEGLVSETLNDGKLFGECESPKRIVSAVNGFARANASSGSRVLAVCYPTGFCYGADEIIDKVKDAMAQQKSRGKEAIRPIAETILAEHALNDGHFDLVFDCVSHKNNRNKRDELVTLLRKEWLQRLVGAKWSFEEKGRSWNGSEHFEQLAGIMVDYYAISRK